MRSFRFCGVPLGASMILLACGLAACQKNPSPQKAPMPDKAAVSAVADGEFGVIRSLEPGDRACYVGLENAKGEVVQDLASFDICEQNSLMGKRVRLTRQPTSVIAASCGGKPDCTQSERVSLIVKAEVAR